MNRDETCMACGKPIQERVYAVYRSAAENKEEEKNVAGFLCNVCSKRHKMKPVGRKNPFVKLEKLKERLER
ncbi:hypothetical protein [Aneurinibacillus thermoaerophilus]|uniref:Uncharacterized protein n=2 Tax=Aneurinibacillus group TaxID=85151 RepID=A0A1G7X700_ANETH|nr:hypothetical protein [Aneurinibacillus thermoaerophilus]MED0674340.1 hypothetical protein [Aneurinibacillus thermoaerophilus]MED0736117.1 hypothetical protein [Aneurinibacillus thermoaerophilus]MED0756961.1 hypothetical protein [Aneurinibacillus thermoaerophilus]MED0761734.1 hypothetical protein [Aneurinibacillus thermoaerophilus]MED0765614.1 hypothetical protein [Aneurinibacillus thermoaerophilus]